jgi:hypothetical protein
MEVFYGGKSPRVRHHEVLKILPITFSLGWEFENLWYRCRIDYRVGFYWALFSLQGHLAADHQHVDNDHYVPNGIPDPKHAEP